jgi:hypothetical protein
MGFAWHWCVGAALCATALCSREALSQTPPDPGKPKPVADAGDPLVRARELFLEGSAKADAGEWEAARDRFARSAQLKRATLTLYNLGIAQEETGHLVEARASFVAFLAAPADPATQRYVDPVRADLAKLEARIPRIDIEVRPAGLPNLSLMIDGHRVAPGEVREVDPGMHEIAVVAPGFAEVHQRTILGEGARQTLTLAVDRPPPRRPMSALLPAGLTAGGAALLVAGGVTLGAGLVARPNPGADRQIVAGASVGAVGAIGLGAGIGLLAVRSQRRPDSATIVPWLGAGSAGVRGSF